MKVLSKKIKRFLHIFLVNFIIVFTITGCSESGDTNEKDFDTAISFEEDFTESKNIISEGPFEEYRPYYNLGSCRSILEPTYILVIFLEDGESKWDDQSINNFWQKCFHPGIEFLKQQAAGYGSSVVFESGQYNTGAQGEAITYNGIVVADLMNATVSTDILDQAASSIGYNSKEEMHEAMKEYSGKEQVSYIIAVNKDGISYTMSDKECDNYEYIEYCVFFSSYLNTNTGMLPSAFAHEMLHLYGASDYYDPYGDFPNRAKLAEQHYSNDIMLKTYEDINYNVISDCTAYSIGLTNTIPDICLLSEWWS